MAKVLLLVSAVLWGIWGVGEKLAVSRAHPYTVQWMYSVPFVVLVPIWYLMSRRAVPEAPFDPIAFGYATGACLASAVAMLLMVFAMRTESASLAVTITSAYPVVTLAIAAALGLETPSLMRLVGVVVVVVGLVILQWPEAS